MPPVHVFDARARRTSPPSLATIARNLVGVPAARLVQPGLLSPRSHDALLSRYCQRLISERLRAASILLAFVTIAWIPIDATLFNYDWVIVVPLAVGRLGAAILFWMIGRIDFQAGKAHHGGEMIALMVSAGIGFTFFSYVVLLESHGAHIAREGCEQYALMPIALIAGIAIFPLSLIEALSLTALPLLALVVGARLCGMVFEGLRTDALVLLTSSIIGAAVTCSVSQMNLVINLLQESAVDPLTTALSRRGGTDLLDVLFSQSQATNSPLSLAILDLDRFKLVNDRYGHFAGDRVLEGLIRALKARLRRQDIAIRWGGEEFVVVMPDTDADLARQLLTHACFPGLATRPDGVRQTVSVGLAERIADRAPSWSRLIDMADNRMYRAKEQGRNQLVGRT